MKEVAIITIKPKTYYRHVVAVLNEIGITDVTVVEVPDQEELGYECMVQVGEFGFTTKTMVELIRNVYRIREAQDD